MCAVVVSLASLLCFFFCSTVTSSTEIYTLSLHDALPICAELVRSIRREAPQLLEGHVETRQCLVEHAAETAELVGRIRHGRSEEHTSELQSLRHLVCRLLLEKKKKKHKRECHHVLTDRDP